jgi:hypothetical protein
MKRYLKSVAASRLAEERSDRARPLVQAQDALWAALKRGDLAEALRLAGVVRGLRGPLPESPLVPVILERLRVLGSSLASPPTQNESTSHG